jgi:hypothetical protein
VRSPWALLPNNVGLVGVAALALAVPRMLPVTLLICKTIVAASAFWIATRPGQIYTHAPRWLLVLVILTHLPAPVLSLPYRAWLVVDWLTASVLLAHALSVLELEPAREHRTSMAILGTVAIALLWSFVLSFRLPPAVVELLISSIGR